MRVLVGLGNPGEQYEKTRHNLGFVCVDALAEALGLTGWKEHKGGLFLKNGEYALFKPQSFMNGSGLPVQHLVDYYGVELKDLCVVADDIYVEPGTARIRHAGGDGGHNGWKSIIQHLGSEGYARVRIGAGVYEQQPEHPMHQVPLSDYVLQKLPAHDQKRAKQLIDKLLPNLVEWLEHGTELPTQTVHL